MASGITTVDWLLLAILAISVLIGLWRGLVFEVMSLVGWVVAYFVAQWMTPLAGSYLPVGSAGSSLNHLCAFALSFVLVLVLWSLLARLVRLLISATPLTVVDRLLGAVFGLLRGVALLLVIATLVSWTPAAKSPTWTESRGAAWLTALLKDLKPLLPATVAEHLPA